MSDVEAQPKGRKEESQLHLPTFSPWLTVFAMATQAMFCGLAWAFLGRLFVAIIPLRDDVASLVYNHQSSANMLITVMSTILAMIGSSLLTITVELALLFRLPRGLSLSLVAPWVQLARNSLYLRPRRYLWWTLISVLWVIVTHLLTTAWSNLLTPVSVSQQFPVIGQDLDFRSPVLSNFLRRALLRPVPPGTESYFLTPESIGYIANDTGYFSQAGRSAASDYFDEGYPSFVGQFNSSTGKYGFRCFGAPERDNNMNYQGLSTSYTLVQQGYTADISCNSLSSPTITLNNTASVELEVPNSSANYTLETWSWSTNCSGYAETYTGPVNLLTSSSGLIGNGLFATSVCLYQNLSGPSNQSFLVVMQSPNNSVYSNAFFTANPNLPTVCQVTPMITTVEVQYNPSGLVSVSNVQDRALPPAYSWPLTVIEGYFVWTAYYFAQGPYSNSFADDLLEVVQLLGEVPHTAGTEIQTLLEQYLRGIVEYIGTVMLSSHPPIMANNVQQNIRGGIINSLHGQSLPSNMSIPISGTLNVQTVGWQLNPKTHSIAITVITLVAIMTVVAGTAALLEANQEGILHDTLRGNTHTFNPTNLVEVLLASSMGGLSSALRQCETPEECEKLMVKLAVTKAGHAVLTDHADEMVKRESAVGGN
ncbi:hypothetical protein V8E55_005774 [Tylopilus felleus]